MRKPWDMENFEPVPVTIRGAWFPSMSAAARAHGVTVAGIQSALERGRLDMVGTKKNRLVAITHEGKTYATIKEFSAALGLPYDTVQQRIKRGYYGRVR